MKKNRLLILITISCMLSSISDGQTTPPVKDYLSVPGPIVFDAKSYNLSWSSHPSANFYKQEYIIAGDNPEKYNTMILLDVLTGNKTISEIIAAKIAELKAAKQTNPFVSYETFGNIKAGEYMLDFIMTANDASGKIIIAERNVYRYTSFTTTAGQKGILLFGVSMRSYGSDAKQFIAKSKAAKLDAQNKVKQFKTPVIKILE